MSKPMHTRDVTKDSVGQQAFLAKVGQDEPIFILRARDAFASITIEEWIGLAKNNGVSQDKIEAAEAHLALFDAYSRDHMTRLPD